MVVPGMHGKNEDEVRVAKAVELCDTREGIPYTPGLSALLVDV